MEGRRLAPADHQAGGVGQLEVGERRALDLARPRALTRPEPREHGLDRRPPRAGSAPAKAAAGHADAQRSVAAAMPASA